MNHFLEEFCQPIPASVQNSHILTLSSIPRNTQTLCKNWEGDSG